ncbi:LysR family transcriptional regulator [Ralstonia pseudosolanacearum]|uniref:LysR family transcriptional regulator n=1 Tax=Ralstonia pseudosolanacearum TaxID=1310165 RepID=UPI000B9A0CC2|nr:LysR family transcriptional regulator [Ralstonia pseudosolanacearum]QKL60336.1 LysR family transcriptional regulator [Ralstonia solanacearum]QKL65131.1 LysR family transcriptional regulator [Ralstonia solanacearum]QKM41376.1 LysR family transcriptional regulator [Ralstonia solanacearum]TYZ43018.1 LysR family transcriptional regulator [Ralstonia solanacearum]
MSKIDLRRVDLNLLLLFEVLMLEGSVSNTADQLGRTQSAVSHALARLREQLGDPLLVKVGGRMQPSPYALELMQEIRPILRSIERVLSPREAFDPAASTRRFRLAVPDMGTHLFPHLMQRVHQEAPGVQVEWEIPKANTLLDVAEGLVDLALLPDAYKRPDGVACGATWQLQWACFLREGHPALTDWGSAQWCAWPHIVVSTGNHMHSPVVSAAAAAGLERKTGLLVPTFGAVAPLLARTNMIATLPVIVLADAVQQFGLQTRPTPFEMPAMPHVVVWSARLTNDPAGVWMRRLFFEVLRMQLLEAEKVL